MGLYTLPATVLAAVVAVKLIGMLIVSTQASAAYDRGDFEAATSLGRWQTVVNVIEPWKAHFTVGVGLAAQELNAEAQPEFERALQLSGPLDQCPIRVNLVLVLERQGDAVLAADGTKTADAGSFYDQALAVIDDADPSCRLPAQQGRVETEKELEKSEDRLAEKKDATAAEPAKPEASDTTETAENTPSDSTVQELQDKLQDAGQARSDEQTADRAPKGSDYAEKPW